jgi:methylglutaconyl-CoA hydratase
MKAAALLVARAGAIGTITLNRPDKRNALDSATVAGLQHGLDELGADDAIRVITVTGAGNDFCAGADLAQLERIAAGADAMENLRDAQSLGAVFIAMRNTPKPIIALVRGNAIAGGTGLAAACDIVLASDDASFGYPEVHLGFVPAMVMAMLRRSVGEKIAFDLVARGGRISAAEALQYGLITRVYSAQQFDSEAQQYVDDLSKRSPSAIALTKRLFYGMDTMSFEDAIMRGAEVNALARSTDDCRAGVRKFLDKKRD